MKHNNKKNNVVALPGGFAVGEAIRQINPDVMAVYPITPQTPIVEYFAKEAANGKADTEIIPVESEHSAMSACIGSAAMGARTMTASSSQGIMYMMEVLPVASSMRLPIVMAVANRAISGPINIHGDHSDAMAMRDHGWIQIFSESAKEAYDNTIIAQKVAEKAMLPATVNLDGFILSHSVESLELFSDSAVKKFIGKYNPEKTLLDFDNPKTFGPVALQNSYFEFRKQIYDAMEAASSHFKGVCKVFAKTFEGAENYGVIEKYKTNDAEKVIVAMGSVCGTIKSAIDKFRDDGEKIGLVKIRLFRPFPSGEIAKALSGAKEVVVFDRNLAFGSNQVLESDVAAALGSNKKIRSVVYGLGGREVFEKDVGKVIKSKKRREFLM